MDQIFYELASLVFCLILSAFFSGSESALFALTKSDIHRLSHSEKKKDRTLFAIMQDPQKILITILTGNLFVNLVMSMISTKLLLEKWHHWGHMISIAIVTPLVIIFCEISPKIIAINSYESSSKKVLPILRFFHILLLPVRLLLVLITNTMIRIFNLSLTHRAITKDELRMTVRLGEQHGVIGKREGTFISNVIRFSKKDASNIMFPRNSAVFLHEGATIREAMKVFLESEVIRIPVYREDIDHVVGMVDSRDLMPYHFGYRKARTINRFIQEIKFFPASRELHDLLKDFLDNGIQMAVVVDEYGGTAGIVTLNKILSELMGRDMTKWEDVSPHEIRKLDDQISIVSGEMQIDDFNLAFNERLESRNADSVGGYIIERLSRIPKRGEVLVTERYLIRVRYIRRNKIETVEIIRRVGEGGAK
ncbi:MAG: HlyC/CorC family transporter [Spirochaetes bacterium]|nr:HlyC/CorC family transporter [Spirochaetota bacterium]